MPDLRALSSYLHGLGDRSPDLRKASARALRALRETVIPELDRLAARGELPPTLIPELRKTFLAPEPLARWQVAGPLPADAAPGLRPDGSVDLASPLKGTGGELRPWRPLKARARGHVDLESHFGGGSNCAAFAAAEIWAADARIASFTVGSDDTLTVWLNGKAVYDFQGNRSFEPDSAKFEAPLVAGANHLVVRCGNASGPWGFAVATSPSSDYAFLKGPSAGAFDPAAFRAAALKEPGDAAHGRILFSDAKGLACVKCHAVGGQGGTVGPDLSSIGGTYPRAELITSVLEPSARIFSGYEPLIVAAFDGRVLTGTVKSDTADGLEIEDADGHRIRLARDEVDDRKASPISLMPVGLVEGLTPKDFADLIAYLESLKAAPPAKPAGAP